MPRRIDDFAGSELTAYIEDSRLADGNDTTGCERVDPAQGSLPLTGLLDYGAAPPAIKRVHATVRYGNVLTLAWDYSSDGVSWTTITSSVSPGSPTDTPLPGTPPSGSLQIALTLPDAGIAARYWRIALEDDFDGSDDGDGGSGGFTTSTETRIGLMELWAEDSSGSRLVEALTLPIGGITVQEDGVLPTGTGDGSTVFADGEKSFA